MSYSGSKFRKRIALEENDNDPISPKLRKVRDSIARRNHVEALEQINSLLNEETRSTRKSQLLYLTGDNQFRQGKFQEALTIYQRSEEIAGEHNSAWFRPRMSQVECLLKEVKVKEAFELTQQTIAKADSLEKSFQLLVEQADQNLQAQQQLSISVRPLRVSVVASRLGALFLQEGEVEEAKTCFNVALQYNPNGSCRARLGLSQIALRENEPAVALEQAKAALKVGNYQAKTLSAWPLITAASRKLKEDDFFDVTLLQGLSQATPALRAKAILLICVSLRNSNNSQWKAIAQNWLSQEGGENPVIAAELRKLSLSDGKLKNLSLDEQIQRSRDLLKIPNLSPMEWLAATKVLINASLRSNQTLNLPDLINQSAGQYPAIIVGVHRHGIALACLQAERPELATRLLWENVHTLPPGDKIWGRSTMRLAKLESENGNHEQAASLYQRFSQQSDYPSTLRTHALIAYAHALFQTGNVGSIAGVKSQLMAAIQQSQDYNLALNLARQLIYSPEELNALALDFLKQGEQLALAAFDKATDPQKAVTILFRLARRQADFGHYTATLKHWSNLSEHKRQWLWTQESNWWEYLSLVYQAYRDSGQEESALAMATGYLNDPATPSQGVAMLGTLYGTTQIKRNQIKPALNLFSQIIKEHPTHPSCGYAYYWLALGAWRQNDKAKVNLYADGIKRCVGDQPGMNYLKDLSIKATCLKADLKQDQVSPNAGYSKELVGKKLESIQKDLAKFSI